MKASGEALTKILSKPSLSRSAEDINKISSYMSNINFFSSIRNNKPVFQECCAFIIYEHFHSEKFVFKFGDKGDKFYILLEGEVSVLLPASGSDSAKLKEILTLKSGSSFGDLALIESKPRSATILTKSECHFAVLGRTDYQRILGNIMKQQRLDLVTFLQGQPLFENFTKGSLMKLSYCFEEKTYKKRQIIFEEGAKIDFLYLIKEGEVKISKKILMTKVDHENRGKYKDLLNKKFSQNAQISVLEHNEFLGLYDIEKGIYENTAVCASKNAVLLRVSIGDFKKRLNLNEVNKSIFQKRTMKEAIHESYISSIQRVIKDKESSFYRKISMSLTPTSGLKKSKDFVGNEGIFSFKGRKVTHSMTRQKVHSPGSSTDQYIIKFKKSAVKPESLRKKRKERSCEFNRDINLITRLNPFAEKKVFKARKPSIFLNIHKSAGISNNVHALKYFTKTKEY